MKNYTQLFAGFFIAILVLFGMGATVYYRQVMAPASGLTDKAIVIWDGTNGLKVKNSLVTIQTDGTIGNGTWSIDASGNAVFLSTEYQSLLVSTLTLSNPIPSSYVTNSVPSRVAMFGADYKLTYDVAETGDGALVRSNAPSLGGNVLINGTNLMQYVDTKGAGSVATDTIWDANGDLVVGTGANTATRLGINKILDRLMWDGTNIVWKNSLIWWEFSEEFGNSPSSGDFGVASGNGGANISGGYNGEASHPGVVGGTTGTTTTNGYTVLTTRNTAIVGGTGAHFVEAWVKTPTALPSAEPYILSVGFLDAVAGISADGAYFRLSTFADVWQCVTVTNSVPTTNSITSPAVGATWYHFRVDISTGGSNAVFALNGVPLATNTAAIPIGTARAYGAGIHIVEDGGVTNYNETVLIDSIRAGGFR